MRVSTPTRWQGDSFLTRLRMPWLKDVTMILSARPELSTSSRMRSAKASWSVVALAPRGDLNSTWMVSTGLQASRASAKVGIFSPA